MSTNSRLLLFEAKEVKEEDDDEKDESNDNDDEETAADQKYKLMAMARTNTSPHRKSSVEAVFLVL